MPRPQLILFEIGARTVRFRAYILFGSLCFGGVCLTSYPGAAADKFFNEKIGPVLTKNCYKCHSAKADEVQGNLLLDTREGIRKGGDNGPAIVPGDVEKSFLLRAIKYLEDDYQMPPSGKLSDEIIADFVKWVEMGAPDPRDGTKRATK